jgi:drug/metabolite transporter (DMT)-like permease
MHRSKLLALGAIFLWASLALLGLRLSHLPPFWLTGVALLIGSVLALPWSRLDFSQWRVPWRTLALGVYGLFGFHFLLFIALRHAPPVQANLVNYLWPLGMVVLAPVLLPGMRLTLRHGLAACIGFAGAALAITGGQALEGGLAWGYLPALGSAFIWASYSLLTQRVPPFTTSAMGLFAMVSGVLSLACHVWLEPATNVRSEDWPALLLMGLGPLGLAFYLWDAALKQGNPQQIGLLSFLTPLLSTLLLLWHNGQAITLPVAGAAALIVGAAWLGRSR